jgi:regulator of sigma E protease
VAACEDGRMSWVLTILGIMALIVLHELGHFGMAKAVGMRVERFSLFFPPTIARFRLGETEYALGSIPAGGYVKITGMSPDELKDVDLRVAVRGYSMLAPWKRIAVILAGPGMNLLIAFALFSAVLLSGSVAGVGSLNRLDPSLHSLRASTSVLEVVKGEPAQRVLRSGDKIAAIDGAPVTVTSARARIDAHACAGAPKNGCRAATPVRLTVNRAGRTLTLSLLPRYNAEARRMLVGVGFGSIKSYGAMAAAGGAAGAMWHATTETLTGFVRALTSSKTRHEVSSIVGITKDAHETVQAGASYALVFLGYISLVLAVINLFPFLPLDGGHVLWSVGEKLRGKRISLAAMYRFSSVGIVLLFFLVINGVSNDIGRLGG